MERKIKLFKVVVIVLILTAMVSGCGSENSKNKKKEKVVTSVVNKTVEKETSNKGEKLNTKSEINTEKNSDIENNKKEDVVEETEAKEEIIVEDTVIEETSQNLNEEYNTSDEYLEAIMNGYESEASTVSFSGTETQNLAQEIVSNIINDNMSEFEKVKAINDYMILNVRYDKENYAKGTIPSECYTAYGAMTNKVAVCAGYAKMFDALCYAAGIESVYVVGSAGGYHAWNQVKVDGKWYNIDVTWNDPDAERHENGHYYCGCYQYFLISDEMMGKTHTPHYTTNECNYNLDMKAIKEGCPYSEKREYCENQEQFTSFVENMLNNSQLSGKVILNPDADAKTMLTEALTKNNIYNGYKLTVTKEYTIYREAGNLSYISYNIVSDGTKDNLTASNLKATVATSYEEVQNILVQAFNEKQNYTMDTNKYYMLYVNEKLATDKYIIAKLKTWAYYDKNVTFDYHSEWEKEGDNVYVMKIMFGDATKEWVGEIAYSTTEFETMIKRMMDNDIRCLSISLHDSMSLLKGNNDNEKHNNFKATYCNELCKKYCLTSDVKTYSYSDAIWVTFTYNGHDTSYCQWEIYKEATCSVEGLNVMYCKICGEIAESETIPKNDSHAYYWYGDETTRTLKCSNCSYIGITEVCMDGIWGYFDDAKALEYVKGINGQRSAITTVKTDDWGNVVDVVKPPELIVDAELTSLAKSRIIGLIKSDFAGLIDNEAYYSQRYYANNNYVRGGGAGVDMYRYQYTKIGVACFCVDRDDSGFNFLDKYVFELSE